MTPRGIPGRLFEVIRIALWSLGVTLTQCQTVVGSMAAWVCLPGSKCCEVLRKRSMEDLRSRFVWWIGRLRKVRVLAGACSALQRLPGHTLSRQIVFAWTAMACLWRML